VLSIGLGLNRVVCSCQLALSIFFFDQNKKLDTYFKQLIALGQLLREEETDIAENEMLYSSNRLEKRGTCII
jgi:hypothetical protein